jgi:nitroimidazol reductase NimA-like FMN-containing flavoprotein (pyridoxamine 5'-phosphate oxidase superfamily)
MFSPVRRPGRAHIRELTRAEVELVLARNHVGRIAVSFHDRVDIRPLHYAYAGGWIYGRTSPGDKLVTIAHNRWVSFETDEVTGPFAWRSVVVHGTFYTLSDDGPATEREARDVALALLRRIVPETLTADDPVPERTVLFRIAVDEATGREAAPDS